MKDGGQTAGKDEYIGNIARQLRLEHGWTIEQEAAILCVSPESLSKYERGERKPPLEILGIWLGIFENNYFKKAVEDMISERIGYNININITNNGRSQIDRFKLLLKDGRSQINRFELLLEDGIETEEEHNEERQ